MALPAQEAGVYTQDVAEKCLNAADFRSCKMIRAVLLDDELANVENLQWKLERYCPDVRVVATFTDPVQAVAFLLQEPPDLLFLDIEMPLMTGFDVLEELGPKATFEVIFVTAHSDFGIKAIKFSALDYILKPVHNRELIEAVEKFSSRSRSVSGYQHLLDNLEAERSRKPGKIALSSKENIEFVAPEEIIACEADSNYTHVFLADGTKRVISRTLRDFEELLMPLGFFRPHLSFLIHPDHVREFQRGDGGFLVMKNGLQVPVSKSKRTELLKLLGH